MTLIRFVVVDLVRNPRRTLSALVGVALGVGLFCGVLFFVDGLSASMTQRAVAPLAIDMQRIVTDRVGNALTLTQEVGDGAVTLRIDNPGSIGANDVTVRSLVGPEADYVIGSATIDGRTFPDSGENPFASGRGRTGHNLGTVAAGGRHIITYRVEVPPGGVLDDSTVMSSYSSRESVTPIGANQSPSIPLDELARNVATLDGVATASQLWIGDLGSGTLRDVDSVAVGPVKILGFDVAYADNDDTITIADGELSPTGAVLSAEAADDLGARIGDTVAIDLPDGTELDLAVSGLADLTRARSLFSSRRGGDLETFIYVRHSVVVAPTTFADIVFPAFERAAAAGTGRLKTPPIREIDITLDREFLAADPGTAVVQTERIGAEVTSITSGDDYLLDNISNTLTVAAADAEVAKRLFVFLGVPGALLAAVLAAYAGNVLAEGQRREQAVLRIRGASRRHLRRMLALRTALLTAAGAVAGLAAGYGAAVATLGRESLHRASTASLLWSAVVGTTAGLAATGAALYVTGRRSIDREIDEDRARLALRPPLWRRLRLDLIGVTVVVVGTAIAVRTNSFEGATGSVYFGRGVQLNLALLVLPLTVWITGGLLAARMIGYGLAASRPRSSGSFGPVLPGLFRRSVGRRPWSIASGAIVASMIVALGVCLATFTASYDAAKAVDARYANGADIRVTPSPTAERTYGAGDAAAFTTDDTAAVTPVVYGLSNMILRSDRTSDPANVAAIDPLGFGEVAPIDPAAAAALTTLGTDPDALLLSSDMAAFLKAAPGDRIHVLLARATDEQVEIEMHVTGLFERLPGFPDGADAVMSLDRHVAEIPTKAPDFFLVATTDGTGTAVRRASDALALGAAATDHLQIDTRLGTLDRDQSSLAALNIAGLVDLDAGFALAMATVSIGIFVFGLLLQRRREYVTLRAQGLEPRTIRLLITGEAAAVAAGGVVAGVGVGLAMGYYFVAVLRPLFVLTPEYRIPFAGLVAPVVLMLVATLVSSLIGSRLVGRLDPTELLRDE